MSGNTGIVSGATTGSNDLAPILAAARGYGGEPDEAVLRVPLSVSDRGLVVPRPYLEPPARNMHLDRPAAASLLDAYARALAQLYALGDRRMAVAAHQMLESRGHQRLGYRRVGNYALEELGMSGRTFRAKAALGGKLEALPELRRAYLRGRITETQARIVAAIASPEDEREWLQLAGKKTVRGLERAARKAREVRSSSPSPSPSSASSSSARAPAGRGALGRARAGNEAGSGTGRASDATGRLRGPAAEAGDGGRRAQSASVCRFRGRFARASASVCRLGSRRSGPDAGICHPRRRTSRRSEPCGP